jgi:platelet-activating factor acetylhydrolase IB subunit alpha
MLWNTSNWSFRGEMRGHDHVIEAVKFAPQKATKSINQLVQTYSSGFDTPTTDFLASVSRDKTVKLWNIHTLGCIHTFVFWC